MDLGLHDGNTIVLDGEKWSHVMSSGSVMLESGSWNKRIWQDLALMRQQSVMCDAQILSKDGTSVPAHSCVIAAASSYLRKLLTPLTPTQPGVTLTIELADISGDIINSILEFIYVGRFCISTGELTQLAAAAKVLKITELEELCISLNERHQMAIALQDSVAARIQAEKQQHMETCKSFEKEQERLNQIIEEQEKKIQHLNTELMHQEQKHETMETEVLHFSADGQTDTNQFNYVDVKPEFVKIESYPTFLASTQTIHQQQKATSHVVEHKEGIELGNSARVNTFESPAQAKAFESSAQANTFESSARVNTFESPAQLNTLAVAASGHIPVDIAVNNMEDSVVIHYGSSQDDIVEEEIGLDESENSSFLDKMEIPEAGMVVNIVEHHSDTFLDQSDAGRHRDSMDLSGGHNVCRICMKSFKKSSHLQAHQLTHTNERPYKCHECDLTFKSLHNLKAHQIRHGEKTVKCTVCGTFFYTKADLQSHMKQHTGDKPYACNFCGKTFTQRGNMLSHKATKHSQGHSRRYECPQCSRLFSTRQVLQRHIARHRTGRGHLCSICSSSFTHAINFQKHMKAEHNIEYMADDITQSMECLICHKVCASEKELETHNAIKHRKEKRFECQHEGCTFSAYYRSQVRKHMKLHAKWTPTSTPETVATVRPPYKAPSFTCEICSKSFVKLATLTQHEQQQHGVGNTELTSELCEDCGKTFPNVWKLRQHRQAMHNDNSKSMTSVDCPECSQPFRDASQLHKHVLVVHQRQKRFQCTECSHKTYYFSEIREHFKRKHKEVEMLAWTQYVI